MKKTISTLVALALTATIAVAQKPAAPAAAPKADADPIIIAAGDVMIRQSEFESALATLPAEYQQYAAGAGKKQFAEDYLRMKMLAAEGMKAGLDKDPTLLKQLNLMRENLVAQAQLKKIEKDIVVTDADLQKVYESKKGEYEQVDAKHILIAFKGSPAAQQGKPELTEEQAKAKAEELQKKVAAGASFEDLAKAESDDTGSGANGGELGPFGRGQMVPEFEKAAFEAKPGDMTVVPTQYGYHVIKVVKHDHTPFDQVKESIERQERQNMLQAALEKMKSDAKITFNEGYFPPVPAATPAASAEESPKTEEKKN